VIPERDPRFGKRGAAGRPCKKLDAELRFEPEKSATDDRLGDAEPARGGRYAPGIGHGDEGLKILDIQVGVPRFATLRAGPWSYPIT
jgi:hypothetical protein